MILLYIGIFDFGVKSYSNMGNISGLFRTVHHTVILKILRYFDDFFKVRKDLLYPTAVRIE